MSHGLSKSKSFSYCHDPPRRDPCRPRSSATMLHLPFLFPRTTSRRPALLAAELAAAAENVKEAAERVTEAAERVKTAAETVKAAAAMVKEARRQGQQRQAQTSNSASLMPP